MLQLWWYSISPKFVHNASAMQWLEKALRTIEVTIIDFYWIIT